MIIRGIRLFLNNHYFFVANEGLASKGTSPALGSYIFSRIQIPVTNPAIRYAIPNRAISAAMDCFVAINPITIGESGIPTNCADRLP